MKESHFAVVAAAIVLVCSLLAPAGTYSGGDGSALTPYRIGTVDDWMELTGASADWGKHFVLLNDINFEGAAITPVAPNANPASSSFQGTAFTGVFDGGGCVLSNFVINLPDSNCVGLFGGVGIGGRIRNLGVESFQITGRFYVGGLAGWNYWGAISESYTAGSVSGTSGVGGLVGWTYRGTISQSYATGAVNGTTSGVGGLVGDNNEGTISQSYATGKVTAGGRFVGGLVGGNGGGTISECYATGAVSGDAAVGGLTGDNSNGAIRQSYATGAVNGSTYVGGLAGMNSGTISRSYATGAVAGGWSVGGFCGYSSWGTITDSYWDTKTTGQATSAGGGTGKTTAQMKTPATFAGWDFAAVWAICAGTNYPRLRWQIPVGDFVCPDGVRVEDIVFLAGWWMTGDCTPDNNYYCGGADLDGDGAVSMADMAIFAGQWMR